ncbi:MAG: helix-turn-helix transcriptional regulator [Roseburia sp.]|nr:helix-turn-helix transcriptional regulator [Roseburia sp.]
MAFADKLKEMLNKKELKAADLARTTGLSEAAISDYLKGKKEPRGRQSIAIAKALNVSLDVLWETGYDSKSSDPKAEQALSLFLSLRPDFQDCALEQIKKLTELQYKIQT